jgi:hypothetical protein
MDEECRWYCIGRCLESYSACVRLAESLDRRSPASEILAPLLVDCAEVCLAQASSLTRARRFNRHLNALCATLCRRCAEQCARYGDRLAQQCRSICGHCAEICLALPEPAARASGARSSAV